jgi:hypothetical protein
MNPIYECPKAVTKEVAELALSEDDGMKLCSILISVALFENDFPWAQNLIFSNVLSKHQHIAQAAVIAVGHLARIHGKINMDKLNVLFEGVLFKSELSGSIQDTLDDIEIFCR